MQIYMHEIICIFLQQNKYIQIYKNAYYFYMFNKFIYPIISLTYNDRNIITINT